MRKGKKHSAVRQKQEVHQMEVHVEIRCFTENCVIAKIPLIPKKKWETMNERQEENKYMSMHLWL